MSLESRSLPEITSGTATQPVRRGAHGLGMRCGLGSLVHIFELNNAMAFLRRMKPGQGLPVPLAETPRALAEDYLYLKTSLEEPLIQTI